MFKMADQAHICTLFQRNENRVTDSDIGINIGGQGQPNYLNFSLYQKDVQGEQYNPISMYVTTNKDSKKTKQSVAQFINVKHNFVPPVPGITIVRSKLIPFTLECDIYLKKSNLDDNKVDISIQKSEMTLEKLIDLNLLIAHNIGAASDFLSINNDFLKKPLEGIITNNFLNSFDKKLFYITVRSNREGVFWDENNNSDSMVPTYTNFAFINDDGTYEFITGGESTVRTADDVVNTIGAGHFRARVTFVMPTDYIYSNNIGVKINASCIAVEKTSISSTNYSFPIYQYM